MRCKQIHDGNVPEGRENESAAKRTIETTFNAISAKL
jgi:hypothetical protein